MDGKKTDTKLLNQVQRISALGHQLKKMGEESRTLIKKQKQMRHELNELVLGLDV